VKAPTPDNQRNAPRSAPAPNSPLSVTGTRAPAGRRLLPC
jgi:hypothetical protein